MWQTWLCLGLIFLILEIFIPGMFFLNFAVAAIICAGLSFYILSTKILIAVFAVLSLTLLVFLRPFLIKSKKQETGVSATYIGKKVPVIEDIDENKGAISIYDERWQARSINNEPIPKGEMVEIVKNESIIMYVKRLSDN